MIFNHQKTYKKQLIRNVITQPKMYKKGKLWLVAGICGLTLAGLSTGVNANADNVSAKNINHNSSNAINLNSKQSASNSTTTNNIAQQAKQLHSSVVSSNMNYTHLNTSSTIGDVNHNSANNNQNSSVTSNSVNSDQNHNNLNYSKIQKNVNSNNKKTTSTISNQKQNTSSSNNKLKNFIPNVNNNQNSRNVNQNNSLEEQNNNNKQTNGNIENQVNNQNNNSSINTPQVKNNVNTNKIKSSAQTEKNENSKVAQINPITISSDKNNKSDSNVKSGVYDGLNYKYYPDKELLDFTSGKLTDFTNKNATNTPLLGQYSYEYMDDGFSSDVFINNCPKGLQLSDINKLQFDSDVNFDKYNSKSEKLLGNDISVNTLILPSDIPQGLVNSIPSQSDSNYYMSNNVPQTVKEHVRKYEANNDDTDNYFLPQLQNDTLSSLDNNHYITKSDIDTLKKPGSINVYKGWYKDNNASNGNINFANLNNMKNIKGTYTTAPTISEPIICKNVITNHTFNSTATGIAGSKILPSNLSLPSNLQLVNSNPVPIDGVSHTIYVAPNDESTYYYVNYQDNRFQNRINSWNHCILKKTPILNSDGSQKRENVIPAASNAFFSNITNKSQLPRYRLTFLSGTMNIPTGGSDEESSFQYNIPDIDDNGTFSTHILTLVDYATSIKFAPNFRINTIASDIKHPNKYLFCLPYASDISFSKNTLKNNSDIGDFLSANGDDPGAINLKHIYFSDGFGQNLKSLQSDFGGLPSLQSIRIPYGFGKNIVNSKSSLINMFQLNSSPYDQRFKISIPIYKLNDNGFVSNKSLNFINGTTNNLYPYESWTLSDIKNVQLGGTYVVNPSASSPNNIINNNQISNKVAFKNIDTNENIGHVEVTNTAKTGTFAVAPLVNKVLGNKYQLYVKNNSNDNLNSSSNNNSEYSAVSPQELPNDYLMYQTNSNSNKPYTYTLYAKKIVIPETDKIQFQTSDGADVGALLEKQGNKYSDYTLTTSDIPKNYTLVNPANNKFTFGQFNQDQNSHIFTVKYTGNNNIPTEHNVINITGGITLHIAGKNNSTKDIRLPYSVQGKYNQSVNLLTGIDGISDINTPNDFIGKLINGKNVNFTSGSYTYTPTANDVNYNNGSTNLVHKNITLNFSDPNVNVSNNQLQHYTTNKIIFNNQNGNNVTPNNSGKASGNSGGVINFNIPKGYHLPNGSNYHFNSDGELVNGNGSDIPQDNNGNYKINLQGNPIVGTATVYRHYKQSNGQSDVKPKQIVIHGEVGNNVTIYPSDYDINGYQNNNQPWTINFTPSDINSDDENGMNFNPTHTFNYNGQDLDIIVHYVDTDNNNQPINNSQGTSDDDLGAYALENSTINLQKQNNSDNTININGTNYHLNLPTGYHLKNNNNYLTVIPTRNTNGSLKLNIKNQPYVLLSLRLGKNANNNNKSNNNKINNNVNPNHNNNNNNNNISHNQDNNTIRPTNPVIPSDILHNFKNTNHKSASTNNIKSNSASKASSVIPNHINRPSNSINSIYPNSNRAINNRINHHPSISPAINRKSNSIGKSKENRINKSINTSLAHKSSHVAHPIQRNSARPTSMKYKSTKSNTNRNSILSSLAKRINSTKSASASYNKQQMPTPTETTAPSKSESVNEVPYTTSDLVNTSVDGGNSSNVNVTGDNTSSDNSNNNSNSTLPQTNENSDDTSVEALVLALLGSGLAGFDLERRKKD